MARLRRRGDQIERHDLWPTPEDIGRLVILPGGEVATLTQWWNAEDGSEWRWQLSSYNHPGAEKAGLLQPVLAVE